MVTAGSVPSFPPTPVRRPGGQNPSGAFLRHLVNDSVGVGPQTVEQIPEPGGTVLEIVQLLFRVLVDILSGQAVKFFVIHRSKAALPQYVSGDVFQQIVEKRAYLGCVEGGRFPGWPADRTP